METVLFLIACIFPLAFLWLKHNQGYFQRRGIPHEKPHLLLGNLDEWAKTKHITEMVEEVYRKHKGKGPFVGFHFFLKPTALITDIDLVKGILIKDFSNFDDRGVFHNKHDDPLSANLLTLDSESWRGLRSKLTPTFTSGKMKHMYPTVLRIGDELVEVVGGKLPTLENGAMEITDILACFTADVIGTCAFGLDCNSLHNPQAAFVSFGKRAVLERRHGKLIEGLMEAYPDLARKLRMRAVSAPIHDFYMNTVRDTVEYREKNNIRRNDFMDMLIALKNSDNPITFNELAAQAFIFFLAGFETSASTMGFALYELARNQDVQDKLRYEIAETLNMHNNQFTYECMKDMKYLDWVLDETLRLYPIAPNLFRNAKHRYETSDPKYYLPAGFRSIIPVRAIHLDPEYYPDPLRFDPERFCEEQVKARPACTWLPFGDGPRNCIGMRFGRMQASIGLVNLIQHFKFSVSEKTAKSIVFQKDNFLLSPIGGIHLRIERVA